MITGMPRSGTTFVGKVLSLSDQFQYLEEPLIRKIGIKDHYPYYKTESNKGIAYKQIFKELIEFSNLSNLFHYKLDLDIKADSTFKNSIKKFLGDRQTYKYWKFFLINKLSKSTSNLLLKEPHGGLLSHFVAQELGFKVLILIRHPGGFTTSMHSLNWTEKRDRPVSLLEQPKLINDYLSWLPQIIKNKNLTPVQNSGLLWHCIYHVIDCFQQNLEDKNRFLIVRIEDLCLNPIENFKKIFFWIDLEWNSKLEQKIREMTSSKNPIERTKKEAHQYHLKRDSKALVKNWKNKLCPEEQEQLKRITDPICNKFYSQESWM